MRRYRDAHRSASKGCAGNKGAEGAPKVVRSGGACGLKALRSGGAGSATVMIAILASAAVMAITCTSMAIGGQPVITAAMSRALAPLVTEHDLDAGYVEIDNARGVYAVEIDVDPGDNPGGWILYVRSDRIRFSPDGAGKPSGDLMWKLDEEDSRSYRRLSDHEAVVLENPEGGRARIMLDILIALDWRTDPGTYGIELLFRTAFLQL